LLVFSVKSPGGDIWNILFFSTLYFQVYEMHVRLRKKLTPLILHLVNNLLTLTNIIYLFLTVR
jgi:hypothetical protein